MTTRETIRKIIEKYRNIAVYGMSKDPGKTAHWIPEQLASKGYQIICVNPTAEIIDKWECYPDLKSVPKRIDVVLERQIGHPGARAVRDRAAQRLGDLDPHQPQLETGRDQRPVERALLVHLVGQRAHLLFGELAHRLSQQVLFLGEIEVQGHSAPFLLSAPGILTQTATQGNRCR